MEKVDIIVPVYNTPARLLERCLSSILNQSYKYISIIAVDDGSKRNDTLATIKKYKDENKIIALKQKNKGVSAARNSGLKKSSGHYVFFLDSDDYIDPDCIERLMRISQEKKAGLVFSGKVKEPSGINDAPFKNHPVNLEEDCDTIVIKAHSFTSQGVLIDGDIARSIRFTTTTTTTGEDTEYIVKAMSKTTAYYCGAGGYNYVENNESVSHQTDISSIRRYLDESFLLGEVFRSYLKASNETVNVYLYLKMARAYGKLSLNYNRKKARKTVEGFIGEKNIKNPQLTTVLKMPLLRKSEKLRIAMLIIKAYDLMYCLNKINGRIKGKNSGKK